MKRWSWCLVMLVAAVAFGTAWAKDNVVQKKAGDYSVEIKMDKDPPVVGMNHVFVAVKDKDGKAVTDAKVATVGDPKLDLGYWVGSYGGTWVDRYGYVRHDFDGFFIQGAVGAIFKLQSVALRAEAGSGLLRLGVGFAF